MMVEVIREGNVPVVFEEEVTCARYFKDRNDSDGCGVVLRVREEDLVLRYYFGSHFKHYYAAVKCPRCGKYTRVPITKPVWERVNTDENCKKSTFDGFDDR